MMHVETRQRVSHIARKLWELLQHGVVMPASDPENEDVTLAEHAFDDHPHDKAVIKFSIDGDLVIVSSVTGMHATISVSGPDKIDVHVGYRIGGPGARPGTYVERSRTWPLSLAEHDTPELVAKRVLDLIVRTLRPDVDMLLAPYKAMGAVEPGQHKISIGVLQTFAKSLVPKLKGTKLDGHVLNDVRVGVGHTDAGSVYLVLACTSPKSIAEWDLEFGTDGHVVLTPNWNTKNDNRKVRVGHFTDLASLLEQLRLLFGPDFARKAST